VRAAVPSGPRAVGEKPAASIQAFAETPPSSRSDPGGPAG